MALICPPVGPPYDRCESKMEELFAIPGFSKLWLLPPGSPSILIRKLFFRGGAWEVRVQPTDFVRGVPHGIMVWVSLPYYYRQRRAVNVSIEILDDTWERTVFHEEHQAGRHDSLSVKRTELEIMSCVDCNDNIPVRCTLTYIGTKMKWWRRLTRILVAPLKMHLSDKASTTAAADVIPADGPSPTTIRHLITIPGYSKLARMPAASSLDVRTFRFLHHSWSITLYPSGDNEVSADSVLIMAMRESDSPDSAADSVVDVAIEILDKSRSHALFCEKQVLGGDNHCFSSCLRVNKTELEAAACINEEDCFTIKCNLTLLEDTNHCSNNKTRTRSYQESPGTNQIQRAPLLSNQKLLNF